MKGWVCILFCMQGSGPRPVSVCVLSRLSLHAVPSVCMPFCTQGERPPARLSLRAVPAGSVRQGRGARGPAAGGAGEGERRPAPLPAVPLVLVPVLVLVLLLPLLVLAVVVVVVLAVPGGRGLLAKHRQRSCCGRMDTHLQRGLLFTCPLPWELHVPLRLCGGRAVTAC